MTETPESLDAIGEFKHAVWRIVSYPDGEGAVGYLLSGQHVDEIAGEAHEYARGLAEDESASAARGALLALAAEFEACARGAAPHFHVEAADAWGKAARIARQRAAGHQVATGAPSAGTDRAGSAQDGSEAAERRTEWAELQRRPLPGRLRYLAGKLTEGSGPEVVALALDVMADEMDGPPGHSEVTLRAEEIHAEHHPGTFVPSLDSCTEHTRAEYEALAQDLTGGQR